VNHRVRVHADFRTDLRAQLAWLETAPDARWIDGLAAGIDEAIKLLSKQPGVGTLEAAEDGSELRRLILRRLPYVIWYSTEPHARGDVWLLRLFHARQSRPRPKMPSFERERPSVARTRRAKK